jgi:hypothetical protein
MLLKNLPIDVTELEDPYNDISLLRQMTTFSLMEVHPTYLGPRNLFLLLITENWSLLIFPKPNKIAAIHGTESKN